MIEVRENVESWIFGFWKSTYYTIEFVEESDAVSRSMFLFYLINYPALHDLFSEDYIHENQAIAAMDALWWGLGNLTHKFEV